MQNTRFRSAAMAALAAALTLSACSEKPDAAALEKGDAALGGVEVDGALMPVQTRVVMVGKGGPDQPACSAVATPKAETLVVHWSTDDKAPPKDSQKGDFLVCDSDGDQWTGIIFPTTGASYESCSVGTRLRNPREYQGPCRWGWVKTADITIKS